MNDQVSSGWSKFLDEFRAGLDGMTKAELETAWAKAAARTRMYADGLISKIAENLKLELRKEFLKIDYVLFESKTRAFRYFIESENNYSLVANEGEELTKLCACRGDVGVLITVVEWDEEPRAGWSSQRGACLPRWRKCVADHSGVGASVMPIVALVGELRGQRLRFYQEVLTGNHSESTRDKALYHVVYERNL